MAQIKPGCRPFHECNPTFFCTTTVLVSRERFEWRNKEQLGDMSVHAFHSQDANQILSHTDTSLHLLTEQTFSTVVLIAVGSNLLQIQELGHLSLSSPPILQPISLPHIYQPQAHNKIHLVSETQTFGRKNTKKKEKRRRRGKLRGVCCLEIEDREETQKVS